VWHSLFFLLLFIPSLLTAQVAAVPLGAVTITWTPKATASWEAMVDSLFGWPEHADSLVNKGYLIRSGEDFVLVLPVQEMWSEGLVWLTSGDTTIAQPGDSLEVRGHTLWGFALTKNDTVAVVPDTLKYIQITWNRATRKKTKTKVQTVAGQQPDSFYKTLFSNRGWMTKAKREQKCKDKLTASLKP
jgi:hypothetical protein